MSPKSFFCRDFQSNISCHDFNSCLILHVPYKYCLTWFYWKINICTHIPVCCTWLISIRLGWSSTLPGSRDWRPKAATANAPAPKPAAKKVRSKVLTATPLKPQFCSSPTKDLIFGLCSKTKPLNEGFLMSAPVDARLRLSQSRRPRRRRRRPRPQRQHRQHQQRQQWHRLWQHRGRILTKASKIWRVFLP